LTGMSRGSRHDVALDRVVAVISVFEDGRRQWGSGYLVARDLVLTAWHCLVDRVTLERPVDWQVFMILSRSSLALLAPSGQNSPSGLVA